MSIQSFDAICNEQTHTLVLGTMPGVASLDAIEYYAHKRNAFWPIMLAMIKQRKPAYVSNTHYPYDEKINVLQTAGFGLWDVLAECERSGSLDSAINSKTVVMNDFAALLTHYTNIRTIAFNGKTAERLFKRHVMPTLKTTDLTINAINWICLPSSSAAMASLSLEEKFEQWSTSLQTRTQFNKLA